MIEKDHVLYIGPQLWAAVEEEARHRLGTKPTNLARLFIQEGLCYNREDRKEPTCEEMTTF